MSTSRSVADYSPAIASSLAMNEQVFGMGATAANPFTPGHWSHSLILRLILGFLFCIGLLFAIRRLTDAVLFGIMDTDPASFWASQTGFYFWQPAQFVAVFLGTMLASAGRSRTMLLGLMIGLIIGFVILLSLPLIEMPFNAQILPSLYFLMPVWCALAGVLGAKVSEWSWHPPRPLSARTGTSLGAATGPGQIQNIRRLLGSLIFGNIRWVRVIIAVIAILGAMWYMQNGVNWVLRRISGSSDPTQLGVQKKLIVTMLQVAVIVLFCAFAAANSGQGLAHGFWIGTLVGVAMLLRYVLFPGPEPIDVITILSEIGWVWLVALVAGAFGAMAMPSVAYLAEKRKVNPSNISVPLD